MVWASNPPHPRDDILLTFKQVELCYSIRYFELNGRGRGNPWSLRQTGVYQRCHSTPQSTWLVLNYSDYMNQRIEAAFKEEKNSARESCKAMQLLPHLFIISAATRNWRSYIESLRQKLSRYVKLSFPEFRSKFGLPLLRRRKHIHRVSTRRT